MADSSRSNLPNGWRVEDPAPELGVSLPSGWSISPTPAPLTGPLRPGQIYSDAVSNPGEYIHGKRVSHSDDNLFPDGGTGSTPFVNRHTGEPIASPSSQLAVAGGVATGLEGASALAAGGLKAFLGRLAAGTAGAALARKAASILHAPDWAQTAAELLGGTVGFGASGDIAGFLRNYRGHNPIAGVLHEFVTAEPDEAANLAEYLKHYPANSPLPPGAPGTSDSLPIARSSGSKGAVPGQYDSPRPQPTNYSNPGGSLPPGAPVEPITPPSPPPSPAPRGAPGWKNKGILPTPLKTPEFSPTYPSGGVYPSGREVGPNLSPVPTPNTGTVVGPTPELSGHPGASARFVPGQYDAPRPGRPTPRAATPSSPVPTAPQTPPLPPPSVSPSGVETVAPGGPETPPERFYGTLAPGETPRDAAVRGNRAAWARAFARELHANGVSSTDLSSGRLSVADLDRIAEEGGLSPYSQRSPETISAVHPALDARWTARPKTLDAGGGDLLSPGKNPITGGNQLTAPKSVEGPPVESTPRATPVSPLPKEPEIMKSSKAARTSKATKASAPASTPAPQAPSGVAPLPEEMTATNLSADWRGVPKGREVVYMGPSGETANNHVVRASDTGATYSIPENELRTIFK